MFSSKKCEPCMKFKPVFVEISKTYPQCFFVYIDILDYEDTSRKYTNDIKSTPWFKFYIKKYLAAYMDGIDENKFRNLLQELVDIIERNKNKQLIEPAVPQINNEQVTSLSLTQEPTQAPLEQPVQQQLVQPVYQPEPPVQHQQQQHQQQHQQQRHQQQQQQDQQHQQFEQKQMQQPMYQQVQRRPQYTSEQLLQIQRLTKINNKMHMQHLIKFNQLKDLKKLEQNRS